MVSLIGADEDKANRLCTKAREQDVLAPANFNCPGQIVVSGSILEAPSVAWQFRKTATAKLSRRGTSDFDDLGELPFEE